MEQILSDFYKDIVKSIPKQSRKRYEILFAQVIGLQPHAIIRGLTILEKLVAMRQALKLLDEEGLQNYLDYSTVYTPLVNTTFNALIAMAKLKSTINSKVVTKAKEAKDSVVPQASQPNETNDAKAPPKLKSVEQKT